jgi:hypothetical protein
MTACILWRRIDWPGHEAAIVREREAGWELSGTAVFVYEARACRLDYVIACDVGWRTVSAQVDGWVGRDPVHVALTVDTNGRWWMNEREVPDVAGAVDVDLNFSPSTNLFPIRRLKLEPGQEAEAAAAWLRFPDFTLERLDQVYRRTGLNSYQYGSTDGEFQAELEVNSTGFIIRYADTWVAEAIV